MDLSEAVYTLMLSLPLPLDPLSTAEIDLVVANCPNILIGDQINVEAPRHIILADRKTGKFL